MSDTIFVFIPRTLPHNNSGIARPPRCSQIQNPKYLCSPHHHPLVGVRLCAWAETLLVVPALRLTLPRALFLLLEALFPLQLPLVHNLLGALRYLPARIDPLRQEGRLGNPQGIARHHMVRPLHRRSAVRNGRNFTAAPVGRRHCRACVAARVASDITQLELARARPPRLPHVPTYRHVPRALRQGAATTDATATTDARLLRPAATSARPARSS